MCVSRRHLRLCDDNLLQFARQCVALCHQNINNRLAFTVFTPGQDCRVDNRHLTKQLVSHKSVVL